MSAPDSASQLGAWRRVAEGIWVLVAQPEAVNLGLIAGGDKALLVDTGSSPGQGAALRSAVTAVTRVPLVAAVVTHAHYDHAYGLAGLGELDTVAHETVGPQLATAGQAVPHRPLAVAMAFDLGGRRVEVAHLGRGHTEGDLVIAVPDADLVFVGDLIESAAAPWYGPDSFPHEWPGTLDGVLGLLGARTQVVPGHGDPVDREFVFEQRGRVAAVAGEIARLAGSGVEPVEALASGSWPFPAEHVAAGIAPGYNQLPPDPKIGGRRSLPLA